MAGRIPQQFIDDLLARTDIVDVIDRVVPLRKAGKNHQARCPFHEEKTPSFTVSQDKQFYHCFGCGANGTAISFLMAFSHMPFIEAVEELASRAGLQVPREGGAPGAQESHAEIHELLEMVIDFYRRQLREHPGAKRAQEYLKGRGITGELAAQFELGFAPPGWDNLISALGKSDKARGRLLEAGMLIKRDNGGFYDRFRDRVMFPIRDHRGRAIGFGGRVLDDSTPKYLNSPETPVFHKGRELYGLYQARSANLERLYIVEGYMDALALVQFGITNVAATLGTAATRDHLERVFRMTSRVVFCFDGDAAGRQAAWRALETSLPLLQDGRSAWFLFMPEDEDPDSFVRHHGREAFESDERLVPLSDHLLTTVSGKVNIQSREGRARFLDEVMPYLGMLPNGALKTLLVRDAATLAGTEASDINTLLAAGPGAKARARLRPDRAPAKPSRRAPADRTLAGHLIRLLLNHPELANLAPDPVAIGKLSVPGAAFLQELVAFIQGNPGVRCAGIIEHWRGTRFEARLGELAAEADLGEAGDMDMEADFLGALDKLQDRERKLRREELTKAKRLGELSEAEKALLRGLGNHPGGEGEK